MASYFSINGNCLVEVELNVLHLKHPRILVGVPYLWVDLLLRDRTYPGMSYDTLTCCIEAYPIPWLYALSAWRILSKSVDALLPKKSLQDLFCCLLLIASDRSEPVDHFIARSGFWLPLFSMLAVGRFFLPIRGWFTYLLRDQTCNKGHYRVNCRTRWTQ